eukprot:6139245-Pyramimonas_sp.AAC.1
MAEQTVIGQSHRIELSGASRLQQGRSLCTCPNTGPIHASPKRLPTHRTVAADRTDFPGLAPREGQRAFQSRAAPAPTAGSPRKAPWA